MFRSLLSFGAIVGLLAATLILPAESHARRCPEEIPETLLSLYKASSTIAIATFDKIEDAEVNRESEDYTIVKTKSYYSITTTLKGPAHKLIVLEDEDYRFKGVVAEEENSSAEHTDEESEVVEDDLVEPGDSVMLFLKHAENEDGEKDTPETLRLEPIGYREGIKKLSGDKLRAYESRVNELNVIFNSAGNRDSAIVAWLVSVTEDPLTRWEGAFEFLQGFQELEWAQEAIAGEAAEAEEGSSDEAEPVDSAETEVVTETDEEVVSPEADSSRDRQRYATLLSDGQKQILLNTFLQSIPVPAAADGDEKTAEMSADDKVLMEVVKHFGDNRLVAALLDQIKLGAGDHYYRYQMMSTVAKVLDDKDLAAIAEEYSNHLYQEDATEVESEESAETPAADPTEAVTGDAPVEDPVNADDGAEGGKAESAAAKQTYGELRAELVAKFITAADKRLATEN